MPDIRTATLAAIHDALTLRGPTGDAGFIRTATAGDYMTPERLRLAREIARTLPATATASNAAQFVDQFVAIVVRCQAMNMPADGDDAPRLVT